MGICCFNIGGWFNFFSLRCKNRMSNRRLDEIFTTILTQDAYIGNPLTGNLYKLPSNDGTANQVMTTNGSGSVSFKNKYLSLFIANAIGASVTTNDHVRFTTPGYVVGSSITVDTSSSYTTILNVPSLGRITLQPGTYKVSASVLEIGTSGNNAVIEAALRNADTGTYFTGTGSFGSGTDRYLLHDKTVVTVGSPTRIEFTFVFASALVSYGKAVIEIEQLA